MGMKEAPHLPCLPYGDSAVEDTGPGFTIRVYGNNIIDVIFHVANKNLLERTYRRQFDKDDYGLVMLIADTLWRNQSLNTTLVAYLNFKPCTG